MRDETPGVEWPRSRTGRSRGRTNRNAALLAAWLCATLLPALPGCRDAPEPAKPTQAVTLTVYAPWPMEKRLRRVFERFQLSRPGTVFRLETGTPGKLVNRMKAGDRPDVYVSMGPVGIDVLTRMGIVRDGTGREVLRQRMVLICSEAMSGAVTRIEDLAKPEVRKVGLGRPSLSAGTYARVALRKAGVLEVVEPKAQTSPLRSYMKGEVDAAIVLGECCHDEDLVLGRVVPRPGIHVVGPVPESLCPAFAVVAVGIKGPARPDAADRFIEFLAGPEAQSILRRRGAEACPICDGDECARPTSQSQTSPRP